MVTGGQQPLYQPKRACDMTISGSWSGLARGRRSFQDVRSGSATEEVNCTDQGGGIPNPEGKNRKGRESEVRKGQGGGGGEKNLGTEHLLGESDWVPWSCSNVIRPPD